MEVKTIDQAKQWAKLAYRKNFVDQFHKEKRANGKTVSNREAWQAVEAKHKAVFGFQKYSSLNSFEASFYRPIRERSKQRQQIAEKLKNNRI